MTQDESRAAQHMLTFFDGSPTTSLNELMSPEVFEPGVVERFGSRMSSLAGVFAPSVLFTAGSVGFSLVQLVASPGAILPAHYHDVDCLYYVVAGEIRIGSRALPSGAGFFVPANVRYAYEAGPEGAKVLEFRGSSRFGITITENSDSKWERLLTAAERQQVVTTP